MEDGPAEEPATPILLRVPRVLLVRRERVLLVLLVQDAVEIRPRVVRARLAQARQAADEAARVAVAADRRSGIRRWQIRRAIRP